MVVNSDILHPRSILYSISKEQIWNLINWDLFQKVNVEQNNQICKYALKLKRIYSIFYVRSTTILQKTTYD